MVVHVCVLMEWIKHVGETRIIIGAIFQQIQRTRSERLKWLDSTYKTNQTNPPNFQP